jgi:hypothetical protein
MSLAYNVMTEVEIVGQGLVWVELSLQKRPSCKMVYKEMLVEDDAKDALKDDAKNNAKTMRERYE